MARDRKHRNKSFWYRNRGWLRVVIILIVVGAGLCFAYWLSTLGAKKIDPREFTYNLVSREEAQAILDESMALEARFLEMSALREPNEEDLAVLEQAIDKQQEYLGALGGYDVEATKRLESLRTLYQDTGAAPFYSDSLTAEREAMQFEAEDDFDQALSKYRRAANLQRSINEDYQLSSRRDVGRLTRLERKVQELRAGPLWNASLEAEKKATEAAAKEDWESAKSHLREAIELQKELNLEFRGLRYADVTRLSKLEVELASLESSNLYEEITAMVEQSEAALAEKKYTEAAEMLRKASRLQGQLNYEHPHSRFASESLADEYDNRAADALSSELGEEILSEIEVLDQSLRDRKAWIAAEMIPSLYNKAELFRENYPRSTMLTDEMLLKLQFLNYVKEDIPMLQDRILGLLLPIPGQSDWYMTRIEVPQSLYRSIMLANPSRNEGDTLPVDSVNWYEAEEFCQKLSWVLGLPVRLPSKEEHDIAVGSLRYVDLDLISWNAQNSDDRTHEVGTKEPNAEGFHDLLGNVGEWLSFDDVSGSGEAYIAGGDAEDSVDMLADVPYVIDNTRRRNRMTGFRFVVNLNFESHGSTAKATDS